MSWGSVHYRVSPDGERSARWHEASGKWLDCKTNLPVVEEAHKLAFADHAAMLAGKPHVFRGRQGWVCIGNALLGDGETARAAFDTWQAIRTQREAEWNSR